MRHIVGGDLYRPRRPLQSALACTLLAVVIGCDRSPSEPDIEQPSSSFYIALGARVEPRLRVLRSDGTEEAAIPCPGFDSRAVSPKWSRDGLRISVGCIRDTAAVLYTVGRDGSNLREVAVMPRFQVGEGKGQTYMYAEFMEDWSADGRLVYVRSTASETSLEIVGADGGLPTVIFRRVNSLPGEQYRLVNPRWSSSGSTVVFDIQGQLYAIESDGTNLRHLTADLAAMGDLVVGFGTHFWSPDGRTVAFISAGNATTALRAVDVPTGQLRTVVPPAGQRNLRSFCWSSDGSRLSVVLEDLNVAGLTYEREAVITLNADGSGVDTVAAQLWLMGSKAPWTKDGRLILARRIPAAGDFREHLYMASLSSRTMTEVSELPSSLAFAVSGSPRCER